MKPANPILHHTYCIFAILFLAFTTLPILPTHAAITLSGSVNPSPPAGDPWNIAGNLTIFNGSMTVDAGSDVSNVDGRLGLFGGNGAATITGSGSTWTNSNFIALGLGSFSTGTLNIQSGGAVLSSFGVVGLISRSNGIANIDGAGSTWIISGGIDVGAADATGTLNITNGGALFNTAGVLGKQVVNPPFIFTGTGTATVSGSGSTWTNTSSLTVGDGGNGTLNINTGGLVIATALNGIGTVNFEGGALRITSSDSASNSITLNSSGGNLDVLNPADTFSVTSIITGSGTLTKSGAGTLLLTANNTFTGGANVSSGTLQIGDGGTTGAFTGDAVNNSIIAFNRSDDITFSNAITGSGGLNKLAAGALTLTGANTYTGVTIISSGTLRIGNGGVSGAVVGNIVNNAALVFNRSDNFTYNGNISGPGSLTKIGAGTLTLNGASTYTGNTTVDAGAIILNGSLAGTNVLRVGDSANASMTIQNDADAADTEAFIGNLAASTGTVTVDGAGSTWTHSGQLIVGNNGSGTLHIQNGAVVSNTNDAGYVGAFFGGVGNATVAGSGSMWNISSVLFVGLSLNSNGTLSILNGGKVANSLGGIIGAFAGSTGLVTADGAGSHWSNSTTLDVGNSGSGTLVIQNGATVSNASHGSIGNLAGGNGSATVSGLGSAWNTTGELRVANSGIGSLTIQNGAVVSNTLGGFLGKNAGASGAASIQGAGSTWNNGTELTVGSFGAGVLNISAGGKVFNTFGSLAFNPGSTGAATIDGPGSAWTNSDQLRVGEFGSGALNVLNGGVVSNSLIALIATQPGSSGVAAITGAGSSWTSSGEFHIGHSGNGTLSVLNGGIVSNTSGLIGVNHTGVGTVTVDGAGSTWTNSGSLTVGNLGGGTLHINNNGLVIASALNGSGTILFAGGTLRLTSTGLASNPLHLNGSGGTVSVLNLNDLFSHTGAITGLGSLTKSGAGTLDLTTANSYTGSTIVQSGRLVAGNNNALGTGQVIINGSTAILHVATGVTITNPVSFGTSGGTLAGNGFVNLFTPITLDAGDVISPGSSPGTLTTTAQTWADGGTYIFEISDATGAQGASPGWDWLNITQALNITTSTVGFNIDIRGLSPANLPGAVAHFNNLQSYSWVIATASAGITGFNPSAFNLNTSNFVSNNSLVPNFAFTLTHSANNLVLNYGAIPEPASLTILAITSLALLRPRTRTLKIARFIDAPKGACSPLRNLAPGSAWGLCSNEPRP